MTDAALEHAYRVRSPETWAAIKADYLAGEPAEAVAERYDVSLSTLRTRARRETWRRADQSDEDILAGETDLTDDDLLLPPEEVAELARRRAIRAIRLGRAAEAQRWTRVAADWEKLARATELHEDGFNMHMVKQITCVARAEQATAVTDTVAAGWLATELRRQVDIYTDAIAIMASEEAAEAAEAEAEADGDAPPLETKSAAPRLHPLHRATVRSSRLSTRNPGARLNALARRPAISKLAGIGDDLPQPSSPRWSRIGRNPNPLEDSTAAPSGSRRPGGRSRR
jgi:hypothetical protein